MSVAISGKQRARFRTDLLAHRETYSYNDAEYAQRVLKISLNTYKKCIEPSDKLPLSLKRQTFVSIFSNTPLDPKTYGLGIGVASRSAHYGGYAMSDFAHLCGRFLFYRRSFLTARDITCGVLEIEPSKSQECLSFHEVHAYVAETGTRQELHYRGDVHINRERSLLSLPCFDDGHVRLMMLQCERGGGRSKVVKMRGALLTFGNPKGFWQPTVSGVFADGPLEKRGDARDLCESIAYGTEKHRRLSAELTHVEEHTTLMTPLMWARLNGKEQ